MLHDSNDSNDAQIMISKLFRPGFERTKTWRRDAMLCHAVPCYAAASAVQTSSPLTPEPFSVLQSSEAASTLTSSRMLNVSILLPDEHRPNQQLTESATIQVSNDTTVGSGVEWANKVHSCTQARSYITHWMATDGWGGLAWSKKVPLLLGWGWVGLYRLHLSTGCFTDWVGWGGEITFPCNCT